MIGLLWISTIILHFISYKLSLFTMLLILLNKNCYYEFSCLYLRPYTVFPWCNKTICMSTVLSRIWEHYLGHVNKQNLSMPLSQMLTVNRKAYLVKLLKARVNCKHNCQCSLWIDPKCRKMQTYILAQFVVLVLGLLCWWLCWTRHWFQFLGKDLGYSHWLAKTCHVVCPAVVPTCGSSFCLDQLGWQHKLKFLPN